MKDKQGKIKKKKKPIKNMIGSKAKHNLKPQRLNSSKELHQGFNQGTDFQNKRVKPNILKHHIIYFLLSITNC